MEPTNPENYVEKPERHAIISYIAPQTTYVRFEMFVTMLMFIRKMYRDMFEPNPVVSGAGVLATNEEETKARVDVANSAKLLLDELPNEEDLDAFNDKCKFFFHNVVSFCLTHEAKISDICYKQYPFEVDLGILVRDVVCGEVTPETLSTYETDDKFTIFSVPVG